MKKTNNRKIKLPAITLKSNNCPDKTETENIDAINLKYVKKFNLIQFYYLHNINI